jgi:hypothetical protein
LDLINIAKLGRQWFGESFDIKQDQEFEFNFPNIDPRKKLKQLQLLQLIPTSFQITSSGQTIGNISFPAINTNSDTEFNLGFTKQHLLYWVRTCKNKTILQ